MYIYPVREPLITSDYWEKRTLPDGNINIHDGIDFISKTPDRTVFSLSQGVVVYDFDDYCHIKRYEKPNTGGNMIIITFVYNNTTYHIRYLHLIENYVAKGQAIKEGQVIGKYGDVGYSFGAHLHLDVYVADWSKKVNPHKILPI